MLEVGVNSYISVVDADSYHLSRGNGAWATAGEKEAALIRATTFLDGIARGHWKGVKATSGQGLAWPRRGAVDEDGYKVPHNIIPGLVQAAVCEIALKITDGLILEPDLRRGGAVKQESIGSMSITYMDEAPIETRLLVVENLLSGLLDSPLFGSSRVVGSVRMVQS